MEIRKSLDETSESENLNKYEMSIYGGHDAQLKQHPWQVKMSGQFSCGGTLISLKTVLTASHCIIGLVLSASLDFKKTF